jgi:uncharacterized damage-inducible protein DinB
MTIPTAACLYIVNALDNTPAILLAQLSPLPANDAAWDTRPDPDRFSLREIVAHLADWETIWQERFERTLREEAPLLLRPDITRRAEEQGYLNADPQECLTRFSEKRSALTARLRSLPEDAWERVAHLDRMGEMPLSGLIALALGHDAYHTRQVAEWCAAAK